jgi:hypothetical protein
MVMEFEAVLHSSWCWFFCVLGDKVGRTCSTISSYSCSVLGNLDRIYQFVIHTNKQTHLKKKGIINIQPPLCQQNAMFPSFYPVFRLTEKEASLTFPAAFPNRITPNLNPAMCHCNNVFSHLDSICPCMGKCWKQWPCTLSLSAIVIYC